MFRVHGHEQREMAHCHLQADVSDLPASRKVSGLAGHTSKHFMCPFCDMPLVGWEAEREAPIAKEKPRRALYGKTNKMDSTTNTYLGRDPAGPLAPLGGPNPLLHRLKDTISQPISNSSQADQAQCLMDIRYVST